MKTRNEREESIYAFGLLRGILLMCSIIFIIFAIDEIYTLDLIGFLYCISLFTVLVSCYLIVGAKGVLK